MDRPENSPAYWRNKASEARTAAIKLQDRQPKPTCTQRPIATNGSLKWQSALP